MANEDEIRKKIENLKDNIKENQAEINELQESCSHPELIVKAIDRNHRDFRKICKYCEKILGYPSPKEIKEYLK